MCFFLCSKAPRALTLENFILNIGRFARKEMYSEGPAAAQRLLEVFKNKLNIIKGTILSVRNINIKSNKKLSQ